MSHRFDHLEENEREWLNATRRRERRKTWLLAGVLVLAALLITWVTFNFDLLPGTGGGSPPATTTVEQRAIADGERALADWGRFAVSNDLRAVKDSFWANGPQYRQLAREARQRRNSRPIGPPPYQMTMTGVQVLTPRPDQRVLRGRVQMTRPGEVPQTFNWDVWLQQDKAAGGRWRLWTVRETAGS